MNEGLIERAGVSLIELGIAGIFIAVLIYAYWMQAKANAKERSAIEKRDNEREKALRETVAKSFDERHDDAVRVEKRLSRIEAKMRIEDRNGDH